jgi:asparaginyl-tRNA synthetase
MCGKNRYVSKSLTVGGLSPLELPRPLEETAESEIERKRVVGRVTTQVLKFLCNEFTDNGFEWLLPVIFSQSTDPLWPDANASVEKRLEVEIYGKTVRPTASMIVHKLVACSLAHPKLFSLLPNIRIEKRERALTGVHAYEFTQLDFEVRDADSDHIRHFVEEVLHLLVTDLRSSMEDELFYLRTDHSLPRLVVPFKVYERKELEKEHGAEWESEALLRSTEPFWVTDFPREFYDFEDFETSRWDNYDLFVPVYGEVLSGARREHEYSKIISKMERDSVRKENYSVLLRLAQERRLKPSAGAGIGLERLVSWLVQARHIGEVQLFPRIPGVIHEL